MHQLPLIQPHPIALGANIGQVQAEVPQEGAVVGEFLKLMQEQAQNPELKKLTKEESNPLIAKNTKKAIVNGEEVLADTESAKLIPQSVLDQSQELEKVLSSKSGTPVQIKNSELSPLQEVLLSSEGPQLEKKAKVFTPQDEVRVLSTRKSIFDLPKNGIEKNQNVQSPMLAQMGETIPASLMSGVILNEGMQEPKKSFFPQSPSRSEVSQLVNPEMGELLAEKSLHPRPKNFGHYPTPEKTSISFPQLQNSLKHQMQKTETPELEIFANPIENQTKPEIGLKSVITEFPEIKTKALAPTPTATPVLNLSAMGAALSTTQGNQSLIDKISDYILQHRVQANPSVELMVKHDDLGQFRIIVERSHGEHLNIGINSQSAEARGFFAQHKNELLQNLQQHGVSVGELKLDNHVGQMSFTSSKDGTSQQSFSQQHSHSNWSSPDSQRRQDSERRQELWQYYKEQREAA